MYQMEVSEADSDMENFSDETASCTNDAAAKHSAFASRFPV